MKSDCSRPGRKVLITCGPTWVRLDDVRVISNRSTGVLGQTLARDLAKTGAQVTLLEGPVAEPLKSPSIKVLKFAFFDELRELLHKELRKKYHAVIHAAAVSDYQLRKPFSQKLSSRLKHLHLHLVPAPKLIHSVKKLAPRTCLVGFKLETDITRRNLQRKAADLFQKAGCDLVVVNKTTPNSYEGYILDKNGRILALAKSRAQISRCLTKILKEKL